MADIIKIKFQRAYKNAALNANEEKRVDILEESINQHGFFNELVVINVSTSDILVTPDDNIDKVFLVPAKSSFGWRFKDDNFKFTNLKYKEMSGAAVLADLVYFLVLKKRYENGID